MSADLTPEPIHSRPAVDVAAQALRNRYGRAIPSVHAAEIMLTAVAPVIEALCHWCPSCGETHEEFHFGNICPYWAVSQVLQGMDDPRPALEDLGSKEYPEHQNSRPGAFRP